VRSLGADEVLDYTRVDAPPSGVRYAFVLVSVGGLKSSRLKDSCKRALAPGGRYVSIDDGNLELSSKRLEQLKGLIESGHGVTYRECGLLARRHRRSPPNCRGRTQARWGRSHDRVAANAD
jgi:NADPH:quinone reductase-like Zn-dependent oxidoreductase